MCECENVVNVTRFWVFGVPKMCEVLLAGSPLIPSTLVLIGLGDRLGWEVSANLRPVLDSKGLPVYDAKVLPSTSSRYESYDT